jgi:hypothetical protein
MPGTRALPDTPACFTNGCRLALPPAHRALDAPIQAGVPIPAQFYLTTKEP